MQRIGALFAQFMIKLFRTTASVGLPGRQWDPWSVARLLHSGRGLQEWRGRQLLPLGRHSAPSARAVNWQLLRVVQRVQVFQRNDVYPAGMILLVFSENYWNFASRTLLSWVAMQTSQDSEEVLELLSLGKAIHRSCRNWNIIFWIFRRLVSPCKTSNKIFSIFGR